MLFVKEDHPVAPHAFRHQHRVLFAGQGQEAGQQVAVGSGFDENFRFAPDQGDLAVGIVGREKVGMADQAGGGGGRIDHETFAAVAVFPADAGADCLVVVAEIGGPVGASQLPEGHRPSLAPVAGGQPSLQAGRGVE